MSRRNHWMWRFACACLLAGIGAAAAQSENLKMILATRVLRLDAKEEKRPVVTAIQLQPEGNLVASAGDTHIIHVWDRESGATRWRLEGHDDWVRSLSVSADGRQLASGGNDGRIILWDLRTGAKVVELARRAAAIRTVQFGQKGNLLAASAFGNRLSVYDTQSHRELFQLECPCRDVAALAFASDDRMLAAAGRNGRVRVWDLQDRTARPIDYQPHQRRIRALSFSKSDLTIATCGDDGRIVSWDRTTGAMRLLASDRTKHFCLAFLDGERLAVGGTNNQIVVYRFRDGQELRRLGGHDGTVASIVCDSRHLASGSFDTTVRLWNHDQLRSGQIEVRAAAPEAKESSRPVPAKTR